MVCKETLEVRRTITLSDVRFNLEAKRLDEFYIQTVAFQYGEST